MCTRRSPDGAQRNPGAMHGRHSPDSGMRLQPGYASGSALIEAILFITILGIAVGAMLNIFANTNRNSAETLIERQSRAIAESLLAEVRAAPFTFCDPDHPNYLTAISAASCPGAGENLVPGGAEAGEVRTAGALRFDNLSDYHNHTLAAITSLDGVAAIGLSGWTAAISVQPVQAAGNWNGVPAAEIALVTVTVTAPQLPQPFVMTGLRSRHAPHGEVR